MSAKENPDKIGLYKRPELNERASAAVSRASPFEVTTYENRIARIYFA